MTQSTSLHVAIVMDGNGRWATRRGLPRAAGHRAGAEAVRRVVRIAPGCGITALTLYAFSSDNWSRPAAEVSMLMRLFAHHLRTETAELAAQGVKLAVIGRRDRLPRSLLTAIAAAEQSTAGGTRLDLRIAVDYSGRAAIQSGQLLPDVDLLIRTGGEQRLSDFLLWECAYAELWFTERMWPAFDAIALIGALALAAASLQGEAISKWYPFDLIRGVVTASAASIFGGFVLLFGDIQWHELPQDDRLRNVRRALLGVTLAVPLLIVFAALFASADPVFNNVLTNLFAFDLNSVVSHTVFIGFWAFLVAGYLRWLFLGMPFFGLTPALKPVQSIVPLATALGFLNALFLLFVVVQLRYFL